MNTAGAALESMRKKLEFENIFIYIVDFCAMLKEDECRVM